MRNFFLISFFFFMTSSEVHGQKALFLKKEFIIIGDTLRYRILFPNHYDKTQSYPLVVFLHGSGERGNDNEKQLVHGASLFTDSLNRINYPAIVLFPQCPENDGWVKYKDTEAGTFSFIDEKGPTKPLALLIKLIKYYKKNEAVDSKRIYVLGLSLGGMGTYDIICRYQRTFAAAIPICGAVNLERLKSVRRLPIRIYHGSNDTSVSPEYARNAFKELKGAGSQLVELKEYPGIGHNSWTSAFAEPDFLSWMFSQHR